MPGIGNICGDPQFVDIASHNYRLLPGSAAIEAGTNLAWMATATDLDGKSRVRGNTTDIGAYQYKVDALACSFVADATTGFAPLNLTLTATVSGTNTTNLAYYWDIDGDGITDVTSFGDTSVTKQLNTGVYSPSLTVSNGVGECANLIKMDYIRVGPETMYVAPDGGNSFPYTNWTSAATSIQDAVDIGVDGSVVIVSNGTYVVLSQVTINDGITVRGKTGNPADVIISQRNYSRRCFYTTHINAVVENMTFNKYPGVTNGGGVETYYGGTFRNCIIYEAKHDHVGGGAHLVGGGTLQDCIISNNVSRRYGGVLTKDAYNSYTMLIDRCVIDNNHGTDYDAETTVGGASIQVNSILRNSLVINNLSFGESGGVYVNNGTVENCTIVNNSTYSQKATAVGGMLTALSSTTHNNIIVDNTNTTLSTEANWHRKGGTINYTCTKPDASAYGSGNISASPIFIGAGDYELAPGSAGINEGDIQAWLVPLT